MADKLTEAMWTLTARGQLAKDVCSRPGVRISKLDQLHLIALARRSVYCPNMASWSKPRPAAFVLNLQGIIIFRMMRSGMFLYHPPTKESEHGSEEHSTEQHSG